ncbi:ATP-dependent DNA ligase [Candidatus Pacearchaeota archaeon]|nr:ATP-dependent DNA ligase [Candidatus Pacearchaeota archaeon]
MDYKIICEVYEKLEATKKGLEKTTILSGFLDKIKKEPKTIYLLQGRVFPDYDEREFGISIQTAIKAISQASGTNEENVTDEFRKLGDLGLVAEKLMKNKKQSSLFSSKLTTEKVLTNLQKLPEIEGKGAVDRKLGLMIELFHSASGIEAKYLARNLLSDLKIGVGTGMLRDAIGDFCFSPKNIEEKKSFNEILQSAYDKSTDFAEVFEKALEGVESLKKISLSPGKPVKVMLFPKAKDVSDAFEIVGKPAAFEYKYDGFRVMINKDKNGEVKIFTRRLDNVTNQFPDVVEYVKKYVDAETFIIDGEAIGFDPKTKKFRSFQFMSQRIKRKYEIERLVDELPIELKIFDIIFYNGKSFVETPFGERRKLIEKIIKQEKYKITLADQIITSDEKEADKFYKEALEDNQEGLMAKSLTAPYKPGARVGYAVKLKPNDDELDLVITGAEWGTGKRAGWLTSFDVSCQDEQGNLMEIGKASSGLKEKPEEGLSYGEMTEMLKELVNEEHGTSVQVRPEIVVSVKYQNIQKSPTYSSGFALRFPRIVRLRPDRGTADIATITEIAQRAK